MLWYLIVRLFVYIRDKKRHQKEVVCNAFVKVADIVHTNKSDTFDEVDGNEVVQMENGKLWLNDTQVKIKVVQPYFYRIILLWGVLELLILSFVLIESSGRREYPNNFLNGFCGEDLCDGIILKANSYKILAAVLLVVGGHKVTLVDFFFKVFVTIASHAWWKHWLNLICLCSLIK